MELEQSLRVPGHRIVIASGIPLPADAFGVQAIADMRHRLRRDQFRLVLVGGSVQIHRAAGVHHEAVRCELPILHHRTIRIQFGEDGLGGFRPGEGAGANQPGMVQQGPAERGMERVVGEGEFPREPHSTLSCMS